MSETEMLFDQEQTLLYGTDWEHSPGCQTGWSRREIPILSAIVFLTSCRNLMRDGSSCKNAMLAISVTRKTAGQVFIISQQVFREKIPRRQ